jgi:hypothetical protein
MAEWQDKLPKCDKVWLAGQKLPSNYEGCKRRVGDEDVIEADTHSPSRLGRVSGSLRPPMVEATCHLNLGSLGPWSGTANDGRHTLRTQLGSSRSIG